MTPRGAVTARSGATKPSPGAAWSPQPDREAAAIVIHSLAHGVAALSTAAETGQPIVLASPPDAGIYAGPGWFREVMRGARDAVPGARFSALLDCGDDAGAAMAAIHAGVEAIVFIGPAEIAARLADIAAQLGSRLLTERLAALLDLGPNFFADNESLRRRCADALASIAAFC
jgi:hypothetical protein